MLGTGFQASKIFGLSKLKMDVVVTKEDWIESTKEMSERPETPLAARTNIDDAEIHVLASAVETEILTAWEREIIPKLSPTIVRLLYTDDPEFDGKAKAKRASS